MSFDYKAFAENQEKLWTGLRVNEHLKRSFLSSAGCAGVGGTP